VITVAAGGYYPDGAFVLDPAGSGLYGVMVGGVFHLAGNIDLGKEGVLVGVNVYASAPHVVGHIIAQKNAYISVTKSFDGTLVAGGYANFNGGGTISGTVIGIDGINTGSSSLENVNLLSQNVSVDGGVGQSTLGTSSGATASSQAAAQQNSQADPQQVASNDSSDDDKNKKKKPQTLKVSRVTVLLSTATTPR
jgi:hypothetical protein